LEILLRFEVDAYLSDGIPDAIAGPSNQDHRDDLSFLTSSLTNLKLDSSSSRNHTPDLQVKRGGYKVPHSSLIELKTRSQNRRIQTSDVIYQLWFSQVRNLIVGYHYRGTLVRIEQTDFEKTKEFQHFERGRGSVLRKLVQVVESLRTAMKGGKMEKAVLLFENNSLKLYQRTGTWDALPQDLISKWD